MDKTNSNHSDSDHSIIKVNKELTSQEIAKLMEVPWHEINTAREDLDINVKHKYNNEEVKLICNYILNPKQFNDIIKTHKKESSSLTTSKKDNTGWWLLAGAAAVGVFLLTRNSTASSAAYRGTGVALAGSGATYAATGLGMAGIYATRIAAMNAAAQAAAHQQMLLQIVGIAFSAGYGKNYFPLYQNGSRGGVFRYTSGGNRHYI